MPPKVTDRSIGTEDDFATRRTQRGVSNKARATSHGREARAPPRGLRTGPRGKRRQDSKRVGNNEMKAGEKDVGSAAPPRGSQRTPKTMRVVAENVPRKSNAPASELISSDSVKIEVFVERQGESTGRSQMPKRRKAEKG